MPLKIKKFSVKQREARHDLIASYKFSPILPIIKSPKKSFYTPPRSWYAPSP